MAAMAVGDVPLFTETYKALLLDTIKVPSPDCYLRPEGVSWEEHSRTMFLAMEHTLAEHHDSVAAVIVEPLIQGAGGMRMYHPVYLTEIHRVSKHQHRPCDPEYRNQQGQRRHLGHRVFAQQ